MSVSERFTEVPDTVPVTVLVTDEVVETPGIDPIDAKAPLNT